MTDHSQGHSPALIREIVRRLSETVDRHSALVAAVPCETGCSRATADRAAQDFLHDFLEQLETSH